MKILVPTDFSDTAFNAAQYAVSLSSQYADATIICYHSYYTSMVTGIPMPILPEDDSAFRHNVLQEMQTAKDKFSGTVPDSTTIHFETDALPLVDGMEQIIDIQGIQLVVMGITGKGTIGQHLIGSNTLAVAQRISVPVIIIPEKANWKPVRKVLLAYNSRQPLLSRQAAAINTHVKALGARLIVVHAGADSHLAAARQELQQWLQLPDISYHTIPEKNIAKDILAFASGQEADMLLALPGHHGLFEDLFHKSVTKRLAYSTTIPLMVIGGA
ncbi:universal stress protein [Chitinophaga vietnamensis]|uniref:universal stress protein n=1 Tax=Chitinophaga vietnamensis TaxID=2593957 RepID=UPI0011773818|nr:universal stress protein [Chitinophaga vietnamensis]